MLNTMLILKFLEYAVLAAAVVYFSNKAGEYVDLLDKKTSLSGAFIGGVMLSAVTSLPEFFTSISSTLMLDEPGLCMGNILGSDLFNLVILAVLILCFFKSFADIKVAKSHLIVSLFTLAIYGVLILNMLGILNISFLHISITSIIILVLYVLGIKYMSDDDGEDTEDDSNCDLTVKQISIRFVAVSICIIAISILITYVTDDIATMLNLGAGLAGALFLGIATSLPELSSTISLFRLKNYNIAIGNIIGSCIFNFFVLAFVDCIYLKPGVGVYDFSDPKNLYLLVFGAIALASNATMFKFKNKGTQAIAALATIGCYIAFLVL